MKWRKDDYGMNLVASGLSIGGDVYTQDQFEACFDKSFFLRFKVRVVTPLILPTPLPTQTPMPTPASEQIRCTIGNANNRYLFIFPNLQDGTLLANQNGRAASGLYNFNLPIGTYRVTLQSYDNHSGHGGQGQPQESWFAAVRATAGGAYIPTSRSAIFGKSGLQNWLSTMHFLLSLHVYQRPPCGVP